MRDRDIFDYESDEDDVLAQSEFEEHLILNDAQRAKDINTENRK